MMKGNKMKLLYHTRRGGEGGREGERSEGKQEERRRE